MAAQKLGISPPPLKLNFTQEWLLLKLNLTLMNPYLGESGEVSSDEPEPRMKIGHMRCVWSGKGNICAIILEENLDNINTDIAITPSAGHQGGSTGAAKRLLHIR